MEVLRFALGLRFDAADETAGTDQREHALGLLLSRAEPALFEGMKLYTARHKLDENDDKRILTVITMGQGIKRTRRLYEAITADPFIMSALAPHRPIIQTNAIFHIENAEYLGEFDADGKLSGGEVNCPIKRLPKESFGRAYPIKIALAPDKFKGSMTQFEVIDVLKAAARKVLPGCTLIPVPAADGGDGTAEVLARTLNGRKRTLTVTGPDWNKVEASYYFIGNETAVIEMAAASGLSLVRGKPDPVDATSFGTGELIADALKNGAKQLLIGIGGSATNDAGIGAATALGVKFTDGVGNVFEGCASNMEFVRGIDLSGLDPLVRQAEITVLCDVTNPMYGKNGATAVFGPQKGADEEDLERLERGVRNIAGRYNAIAGREVSSEPGSGAAGAMGGMLAALLGAKLVNGAGTVLDRLGFDKRIAGSDIVVTGEGRFDATSIDSMKATGEVIARSRAQHAVPLVIAGCLGAGWEKVLEGADVPVFSTVTGENGRLFESDRERLMRTAERAFTAVKRFWHN